MKFESISKVPGFKFGHAQNFEALTGCTIILCDDGCIGGVDQRGGSPGTRETDLLRPMHMVETVNAILLTAVRRWVWTRPAASCVFLKKGKRSSIRANPVPIVPGAVIFDLGFGSYKIRLMQQWAMKPVRMRVRTIQSREISVPVPVLLSVRFWVMSQAMKVELATQQSKLAEVSG